MALTPKYDLQMVQMNDVTAFTLGVYGLKQSILVWNRKADKTLTKMGLVRFKVDPYISVHKNGKEMTSPLCRCHIYGVR